MGSKISAIFCVILAQLIILKALFLVFFLKSKSIVKGKKSLISGIMLQIFKYPFYSFLDSFTIYVEFFVS